jgi:hypothetical protein
VLTDDQILTIANTVAEALVEAIGDDVGINYDDAVKAAQQALRDGALAPDATA